MLDVSWLTENTSLVKLPDDTSIYQHNEGQKISSDNENLNNILYQRFSSFSGGVKDVLELGVGNGINSIMLKKKFPVWNITGLELDHDQVELATFNCELLGLEISMLESDLRDFVKEDKYDLIVANPPYKKVGSGKQSPKLRTNIAKFELTCTMEDVFFAIERNISKNGEAWLLYSQDREEELVNLINQKKFKIIDMIRTNKTIITGIKNVAN